MILYGGRYLKTDIGSLDVQAERLSFDDLKDFARRTWPGRLAAIGMEWLEPEDSVVLNRLTWPTNWRPAVGHFLATDADLAILRPAAYSGGTLNPLPFTLDDGKRNFTTYLYMLPPRPLGQCGTGGDQYLLTLVDQRYFWHDKAAVITAGGTWAALFAQYAAALGVTITVDPVPSAYGTVPSVFARSYDPIPFQMEAAARTIGMSLVVGLDGSVKIINTANGLAQFAANLTLNPVAAGGLIDLTNDSKSDLGGVLPASVTVVDPTDTAIAVTLISLAMPQFSGATTHAGTYILRTPLTNSAGLANQAATDWYAAQAQRPDVAYNGVCPWIMSGFENQVAWTHLDQSITTRVQRPPWRQPTEFGLGDGSIVNNLTVNNLTIYEILLQYTAYNLTVNVTNFDTTGVSKWRFTATGAWTIQNIVNGTANQLLYLLNVSSSAIGLLSTGNIATPWGVTYFIWPGREIVLQRDGTSSVWRFAHPTLAVGTAGAILTSQCDRLIIGSGMTTTDNGDGSNTLTATGGGGTSVEVVNADATQDTPNDTLFVANNIDPGILVAHTNQNGRLYWKKTAAGQGQLDWVGLAVYVSGVGRVGPAPDLQFLLAGAGAASYAWSAAYNAVTNTDDVTLTVPDVTTFSGVRVTNHGGGSQAVAAAGTVLPLVFQAAQYDVGGYFLGGAGTSDLTALTTTKYEIGGNIYFARSAGMGVTACNVVLQLKVNGTTLIAQTSAAQLDGTTPVRLEICTDYAMTAGDTVQLQVFLEGAGTTGGGISDLDFYSPVFWMHPIH